MEPKDKQNKILPTGFSSTVAMEDSDLITSCISTNDRGEVAYR